MGGKIVARFFIYFLRYLPMKTELTISVIGMAHVAGLPVL